MIHSVRAPGTRARGWLLAAVTGVVLFAVSAASPLGTGTAHAKDYGGGATAKSVGLSIFYLPAKVCYAVLGGTTAGLAYAFTFGDQQVTSILWDASVKGDYIVTPAMAEGDQPVRFKGP